MIRLKPFALSFPVLAAVFVTPSPAAAECFAEAENHAASSSSQSIAELKACFGIQDANIESGCNEYAALYFDERSSSMKNELILCLGGTANNERHLDLLPIDLPDLPDGSGALGTIGKTISKSLGQ